MNAYEYQLHAQRTECDQLAARGRVEGTILPIRLNHSVLGMTGEVGELAAAVERWIYYGQELDRANVKEELGDLLWYIAECCNAMDFDLQNVMECNIAKLKKRYPAKYDGERAKEENRNRPAERAEVSAEEYRLTPDYPRLCVRCGFTPVHKSNALGICPNCIKP